MRTGVSEDPKGDPSQEAPGQPEPDRRAREGIEPLLPEPDAPSAPAGAAQAGKTAGDRRGQQDAGDEEAEEG